MRPAGGAYQRWADFLDAWATGTPVDGRDLPVLDPTEFAGDTWERFTRRLADAVSTRLQGWADALTAAVDAARTEFDVGRALAQARGGLHVVRAVAEHPALPPEVATRLRDMVDRQVRSLQEEVERQVDRAAARGADARNVEARRRTIRDNALTAVLARPASSTAPPGRDWFVDPSARNRRRVVPG